MSADTWSASLGLPRSATPTVTDVVAAAVIAPAPPRMRGRLHAVGAVVSVVTGLVLVAVSAALRTLAAAWSTAVYAVSIVALFSVSGLYHRRAWTARARLRMRRLDHSMIFLLIAGSYTPIAVLALPAPTGATVLTIVWSGAIAGIVLKTAWPTAPRWIGVLLYIALGWTAVFVFPDILHSAGPAALVLVIAGGVAYTLGAVVYATKRPNPNPAIFGFHEVFHACTLLAASCHYLAIWLIVF